MGDCTYTTDEDPPETKWLNIMGTANDLLLILGIDGGSFQGSRIENQVLWSRSFSKFLLNGVGVEVGILKMSGAGVVYSI